jgi:HEPN domain-containing protein
MVKSKRYREDAEENYNKHYFDLSMFSLHQSLELFLKGMLILRSGDFPHTHSLRSLLELLKKFVNDRCTESISKFLADYNMEISVLTDAYITSRYFESNYNELTVSRLIKLVINMEDDLDVC